MSAMAFLLFVAMLVQTPQPADRFVTVNGLRIHFLDWGAPEKPPLIMLHGIGRVAHTFRPYCATLYFEVSRHGR